MIRKRNSYIILRTVVVTLTPTTEPRGLYEGRKAEDLTFSYIEKERTQKLYLIPDPKSFQPQFPFFYRFLTIPVCLSSIGSPFSHRSDNLLKSIPLVGIPVTSISLWRSSDQSTALMTSVFRGSRNDIETGFAEFIPERRAVRLHPARQVNSNSLAFLVTVLLLFMILHSNQMSPNFMLWLVLGVFLMATTIRMYAACQQLQAQAQIHAAAANGLLGHTELRLHMPSLLANRGRLQSLRLQLALLDREFDDLDYETLRALDADNVPTAPSMTEEEINALPIHKYKVTGPQSSSVPHASSSVLNEKKQDSGTGNGSIKSSEDALTCTVCLEQVLAGELIRSLPCLHQFHANCIDPWLRQQGTCPVCKYRAGSAWHENGHELDGSYPN